MDRYRIIGKSKQMTSLLLLDEEGKLKQHRILLGKQIEVNEDQLTFHVQRLIGKKELQLLNLGPVDPKAEPEVAEVKEVEEVAVAENFVVEETPAVAVVETESEEAVVSKPKKGRGRKKKKKSAE
jgi:hypothetical protein